MKKIKCELIENLKLLIFVLIGFGVLFSFSGCSKPNSDDTYAGIEVGNPSITVSTAFSLEYTKSQEDYLAKNSDYYLDGVEITNLKMVVKEVRNHGSDYINTGFDPNQGVVTFSSKPEDEAKIVDFVNGEVPAVLGKMDIETRLLKDIEFSFELPDCVEGIVYGKVNTKPLKVCFNVAGNALDLRFHYSQLDTISEDEFDLDIKFYVRNWLKDIDLISLVDNSVDDTLRIDSVNNSSILVDLQESFVISFNAIVASTFKNEDDKITYESFPNNSMAWMLSNPIGSNLIKNSNFLDSLDHWIFFLQEENQIVSENYWSNNSSIIDIEKGGQYFYSIQFMQENIILIEGQTYVLKFKAKSTKLHKIEAKVAMYLPPYRRYNDNLEYELNTEMNDFEIKFVPWQTDFFARVEFNLGAIEDAQVTIESVELYLE